MAIISTHYLKFSKFVSCDHSAECLSNVPMVQGSAYIYIYMSLYAPFNMTYLTCIRLTIKKYCCFPQKIDQNEVSREGANKYIF
jgi:hypothetical protein